MLDDLSQERPSGGEPPEEDAPFGGREGDESAAQRPLRPGAHDTVVGQPIPTYASDPYGAPPGDEEPPRRDPLPIILGAIALVVGIAGLVLGIAALASDDTAAGEPVPTLIGTDELVDGAVTNPKLDAGAVGAGKLADGAVTATKLEAAAVTTDAIADGAVTEQKLAEASVTTGSLADGSVTGGKLEDGSVTGDKLAEGALGDDIVPDGSVTSDKLAEGAVETPNLADAAVTGGKVADDSLGGQQIDESSLDVVPAAETAAVAEVARALEGGGENGGDEPLQIEFVEASSDGDPAEAKGPVTAECPDGMQVIGGGATIVGPEDTGVPVALVTNTVSENGWAGSARAFAESEAGWRLDVTAICTAG